MAGTVAKKLPVWWRNIGKEEQIWDLVWIHSCQENQTRGNDTRYIISPSQFLSNFTIFLGSSTSLTEVEPVQRFLRSSASKAPAAGLDLLKPHLHLASPTCPGSEQPEVPPAQDGQVRAAPGTEL